MFNSLSYTIVFTKTGRKLSQAISFAKGFTAITGPNESGKSMVFEVARFCLFGSNALRGVAEDYKTFDAQMCFDIRGIEYTVERTMKKAKLLRGDKEIAVGTSVVNQKIVSLLGFGIAVFDVACSINQGEVERLGNMKATERRKLIDSVIGLDVLDVVAGWAAQEATARRSKVEGLRRSMVQPIEPEKPELLASVEDLKGQIEEAKAFVAELNELTGWLQHKKVEPVAPTCRVPMASELLKDLAEKRRTLRQQVENLTVKVTALPEKVTYTADQITEGRQKVAAYALYRAAQEGLKYNRKPVLALTDANYQLDQWRLHLEAKEISRRNSDLKARIDALEADKLQCPSCQHTWHTCQGNIDTLKAQLQDLGALIAPPPTGINDLNQIVAAWKSFDQAQFDKDTAVPAVENPGFTTVQLDRWQQEIEQHKSRGALITELAPLAQALSVMPDYEKMLNEREVYEQRLADYVSARDAYLDWAKEAQAKTVRFAELQGWKDILRAKEAEHIVMVSYQNSLERYQADLRKYTELSAEVSSLDKDAEQFVAIKTAMNILRGKVKQHLVPSLNKVASHLLQLMTGGQRRSVVIDEQFDVIIDGQPLHTLSGSGKSVANLSIRIALGQVLTNRVFSVLLADEIDAAMDKFRSEQTSNVLLTLTKTISQVLLVSHKDVDAEHRIQLGETDDSRNSLSRTDEGDL